MYPNVKAEMARKGMTIKELHARLNENGIKIALSTLSQKLNGKYKLCFEEAEAIGSILNPDMSLKELFQRKGA